MHEVGMHRLFGVVRVNMYMLKCIIIIVPNALVCSLSEEMVVR